MSYPPPPPGSTPPGGYPPPPAGPPNAPPPVPPTSPYPAAGTPAPPAYGGYGGPGGPGVPGAQPPAAAPRRRSKLPFLILGVVALLVVAALAVVGLGLLRGDPEPGDALPDHAEDLAEAQQDRLALAGAIREGDPELLADAIDDAEDVIAEEAEPAELGEATELPLGDAAMAIATFEGEADTSYTVSASLPEGEEGTLMSVALPPEGDPIVPAEVVDAATSGEYRVLLVADEEVEGDITVRVKEVEVVAVELAEDDEIAGELAEAGDAIDYEFAGEAGQHYLVYLTPDDDGTDLTSGVLSPDGASVATVVDPLDEVPRFVAEQSGDYRIRVTGGMGGATGAFTIEVVRVAEYYFYYGDDPEDPTYIERTQSQFQPPVADDNRAHFCVFIREGVTISFIASVNDTGLDIGIDVFGRDEEPPLDARVNDFGPGADETWTFTANTDQWRCIQLWGVDNTGGSFSFRFTVDS